MFWEHNMKPESFANQLMFCAFVFIFQTSAFSTSIIYVKVSCLSMKAAGSIPGYCCKGVLGKDPGIFML